MLFADLRDAGVQLAGLLAEVDAVIVPIMPNGVPVALGIRSVLDVEVSREPIAGRAVVVVDDGVETGGAARRAAAAMRAAGVERVLLAVPAGPAAVLSDLAEIYDEVFVVAVDERPLASLYERFDTIDEQRASALLTAIARDLPRG